MHEAALIRDVLHRVEAVAAGQPGARVTVIRLWVGGLAHLTEAGLRERWSLATEGSAAKGARLEITVSEDLHDPRAEGIVLESLDLTDPGERR